MPNIQQMRDLIADARARGPDHLPQYMLSAPWSRGSKAARNSAMYDNYQVGV